MSSKYGYCEDLDTFNDAKQRIKSVLNRSKRKGEVTDRVFLPDSVIENLSFYLPTSMEEYTAMPQYKLTKEFKKVKDQIFEELRFFIKCNKIDKKKFGKLNGDMVMPKVSLDDSFNTIRSKLNDAIPIITSSQKFGEAFDFDPYATKNDPELNYKGLKEQYDYALQSRNEKLNISDFGVFGTKPNPTGDRVPENALIRLEDDEDQLENYNDGAGLATREQQFSSNHRMTDFTPDQDQVLELDNMVRRMEEDTGERSTKKLKRFKKN